MRRKGDKPMRIYILILVLMVAGCGREDSNQLPSEEIKVIVYQERVVILSTIENYKVETDTVITLRGTVNIKNNSDSYDAFPQLRLDNNTYTVNTSSDGYLYPGEEKIITIETTINIEADEFYRFDFNINAIENYDSITCSDISLLAID